MANLEPEIIDLAEKSQVWVQRGAPAKLELNCHPKDISGWSFILEAEERRWPYSGDGYQDDKNESWTDTIFTKNVKVLEIEIPEATINSWNNTTMELTLYADDGTTKWVMVQFTLTVSQGE